MPSRDESRCRATDWSWVLRTYRQQREAIAPAVGFGIVKSGRLDSNQRQLGSKPSALTRLSYAPWAGLARVGCR